MSWIEYEQMEKLLLINKMYCNFSTRFTFFFASAGKLNALEDWRLARLDLMHKFEVQEEQIAKQEESHKTTLYETEKSVIIAKAKLIICRSNIHHCIYTVKNVLQIHTFLSEFSDLGV